MLSLMSETDEEVPHFKLPEENKTPKKLLRAATSPCCVILRHRNDAIDNAFSMTLGNHVPKRV